jgi:hypothetical protein
MKKNCLKSKFFLRCIAHGPGFRIQIRNGVHKVIESESKSGTLFESLYSYCKRGEGKENNTSKEKEMKGKQLLEYMRGKRCGTNTGTKYGTYGCES